MREAVEKCHRASIRIIMVTGDYGLTALSIAKKIGIVRGDNARVVTGLELEKMSDLKRSTQGGRNCLCAPREMVENNIRIIMVSCFSSIAKKIGIVRVTMRVLCRGKDV